LRAGTEARCAVVVVAEGAFGAALVAAVPVLLVAVAVLVRRVVVVVDNDVGASDARRVDDAAPVPVRAETDGASDVLRVAVVPVPALAPVPAAAVRVPGRPDIVFFV